MNQLAEKGGASACEAPAAAPAEETAAEAPAAEEHALNLFSLFLRSAFLHYLGSAVHNVLCFLQAKSGAAPAEETAAEAPAAEEPAQAE